MSIRFDQAWAAANSLAKKHAISTLADITVIRDLTGRITLVSHSEDAAELGRLESALREAANLFASPAGVTQFKELFLPEMVSQARDLVVTEQRSATTGRVSTIERGIVGNEWIHAEKHPKRGRVAMYSFKGGVGRSTASFLLAQHLANRDLCVLVIDLDLESPGVSTLLQPIAELPDFGIVDQLAEAAVGNDDGLELVGRSQSVSASGIGEVWIAPAHGRTRPGYHFIPKLNRAYTDIRVGNETISFPRRLDSAVQACEDQVAKYSRKPDVVILDSRAGIHDIAAIAITQLAQFSLLFATDSTQTWTGYHALFQQWQTNVGPEHRDLLRRRIKMVAAMTPPDLARKANYLAGFCDNAQDTFAKTLYDDESDEVDLESFNFATDDEFAPHFPLPIAFSSELVGMSPERDRNWQQNAFVQAAYADFLAPAADLILNGDE